VCAQCWTQSIEQSAAAGGASGLQALLAAGATAFGANSLGSWLLARDFRWVTRRRLRIAGAVLVSIAIVAALQLFAPTARV
jgi:hypothetical protein